jgi:hypothetical protein
MCSAHRVETTLEERTVESYQDFMRRHFTHGLQAFALILALAFGLAGQGLASATMPSEPGGDWLSNLTAMPSGMCRGCEGMDHSKGMPSNCAIGVCSGVIAVLPTPVPFEALLLPSYRGVSQDKVRGLTISPPLGPPRTLHFG